MAYDVNTDGVADKLLREKRQASTMYGKPTNWIFAGTVSLVILLGFCLAGAEEPAIRPGTCIVNLHLPAGAMVTIDGRSYGTKREFTFDRLRPGQRYESKVVVRFSEGGEARRSVVIEEGRRLRLALYPPGASLPEIVVQTGYELNYLDRNAKVRGLSPDGRFLAVETSDVVNIWSVETGNLLRRFSPDPNYLLNEITFSPDSKYVAANYDPATMYWGLINQGDPKAILWDLATGTRAFEFIGRHERFDPTGRYLTVSTGTTFLAPATKRERIIWDLGSQPRPRVVKQREIESIPWHGGGGKPRHSADLRYTAWESNAYVGPYKDRKREVVVWDNDRDRELFALKPEAGHFLEFRMSPSGEVLAVARHMGRGLCDLALYDVRSGKQRAVLGDDSGTPQKPLSGFQAFEFSPDSRYILVTTQYGGARLWNVAGGELVWTSPLDQRSANKIAFTPNGERVVLLNSLGSSYGGHIYILNASDGKQLTAISAQFDWGHFFAVSPDGRKVIIDDGVWDTGSGEFLHRLNGQSRAVKAVSFAQHGLITLIGNSLWDLANGQRQRKISTTARSISPNGRYVLLVPGEQDAGLLTYRGISRNIVLVIDSLSGDEVLSCPASKARFSPDSQNLVSFGGSEATVWRIDTGEKLQTFNRKPASVFDAAFHPNGREIALLESTSHLYQFHGAEVNATPEQIRKFGLDRVRGWVTNPKGNKHMVYFTKGFGHLSLFDVATGRRIREFDEGKAQAQSEVVFSPDGSHMFTAGAEISLVWDTKSGNVVSVLDQEGAFAQSPAFSPDGSQVVITTRDGAITVWSIEESIGKKRFISSPSEGQGTFWEASLARKVRTFRGHTAKVNACTFSPNGRFVLSGSDDGTARLWEIATGSEVAQLVNVDEESEWLVATPEGLFDGSERGRQQVTYRIGGGLNVVPVDRFFQDFYRPGLLASIWRGERLFPDVNLARTHAPTIKIVSPERGTSATSEVTLEVQVTDQGSGIRGPWLVQNGARVLAEKTATRDGKTSRERLKVALVEGENVLEVLAASEDGVWESEPARLVLRYEKPLPKQELYLVAIGVNRYADSTINLNFAAADAQAVAKLFEQRGSQLFGDDKLHVKQLLDESATRREIAQTLKDIAARARPQDVFVLYLAGHGTMVGQRYYFLPHEFRRQAEKLEEDIREQGIAGDELDDLIRAVPALKRVVIYDTCQSGGALALARTSRSPFAFRGALERMSRAQGSFTIAAAAATDEAQESPQLGHGVLTYALLAAAGAVEAGPLVKQPLRPQTADNLVDVREWFSFAQDKVPSLTKLYFGQEQFVGFSGQGNSFPLLPAANGARE